MRRFCEPLITPDLYFTRKTFRGKEGKSYEMIKMRQGTGERDETENED